MQDPTDIFTPLTAKRLSKFVKYPEEDKEDKEKNIDYGPTLDYPIDLVGGEDLDSTINSAQFPSSEPGVDNLKLRKKLIEDAKEELEAISKK